MHKGGIDCTWEAWAAYRRHGLAIEDMAAYGRYGLPMEDVGCIKEVWPAHERYGLSMEDVGYIWVQHKVMLDVWGGHMGCMGAEQGYG